MADGTAVETGSLVHGKQDCTRGSDTSAQTCDPRSSEGLEKTEKISNKTGKTAREHEHVTKQMMWSGMVENQELKKAE